MARGNPDYFTKTMGESERGYPISPAVIPHIWFKDDFESPVMTWRVGNGTLSLSTKPTIAADDGDVLNGSCSLKFLSSLAGRGQIARDMPVPVITGKIGFFYHFYILESDDFTADIGDYQLIHILFRSNYIQYNANIAYVPSTYKWYISEDNGATWVEFITFRLRDTTYNSLKLVVDFNTNKYDKMYINGYEVDLSAYDLKVAASAEGAIGRFFIDTWANAAVQTEIHIDEFIVTIYEA